MVLQGTGKKFVFAGILSSTMIILYSFRRDHEIFRLSPTIPQRSLRELVSKRRQLNYLKTILQDLDNKLEKLEKRSCPINIPGMDCDYGYIKGSGKDHNIWMSEIGPGKKRRKRLCAFNLPGMNCEFPEIVGIGKDTSAWNNGEGPGRKRSRDRYPPLLRNLL